MEKEPHFSPQTEDERNDDNPHYLPEQHGKIERVVKPNIKREKSAPKPKLEKNPDQDEINKKGIDALKSLFKDK